MPEEEQLKFGKGVAFVKSRLKRLPQGNDTWEADFHALPKPIMQTETPHLGMVVRQADGSLLSDSPSLGWTSPRLAAADYYDQLAAERQTRQLVRPDWSRAAIRSAWQPRETEESPDLADAS
ncbi:MAG: hypothetical protein JWN86_2998 [Planctomycetota bacterium]|nr:hypothetical protein [Planctomycetota bacterium]